MPAPTKTLSGHIEPLPRRQNHLRISSQSIFVVSLVRTTRLEQYSAEQSDLVELRDSFNKRVSSEPALFLGHASRVIVVTNSGPPSSRICTEGGRCWECVISG